MEKNRICHVCGKKYAYCPSCPKDKSLPSWHVLFCSEQCKDVDDVLAKHTQGKITDAKAAKMLIDLNASAMGIVDEDIKKHIDDLLAEKAGHHEAKSVKS